MSQDAPSDCDRPAQPTVTGCGDIEWGPMFTAGSVLDDRYEIRSLVGCGGMGEVWHAFDLKLRMEVALKALRPEISKSDHRLQMLRREVRAARAVMSPNVCRIFDLIEIDGRELVSMEFVDGATLLAVLEERGPLDLKEAQDIASQFLAGLEAIHRAGLVHRDVKPENIMLTRAGRVVLMDFGLARQTAEGSGSVSGTPAYMAPEQAAGLEVDPRADVFSAGVVLAEMVSPEGIESFESRQNVWDGVRSEPVMLPDSPWAPVIKKAVTKDRTVRYNSAHTLSRALEDVTLRVEGADDLHPYPGLAAFTEDDAKYFFGREAEVERIWSKLDRPRLLALVGPSGAGKTSFLQAGLVPRAAPGWGIVRFTPGMSPLTALGQAMAREMAGDVEAIKLLAMGDNPDALVGVAARWKSRHEDALLIVDQFEELFTHNRPDEQRRFCELTARLPLEADVFVLVSMRDDFLMRCREHEAMSPAFADLTALLSPTGTALRRALTQPALRCGYRFADDNLVDEMLAEVEGERGALPLMAFAAARLWEQRDRETGFLTREAYHAIGGVAGALAQHAEATVDRIGAERITVVRELFRNLITAEGTRAVRGWHELLSVFRHSQRDAAAEVLRQLIDARLLTSYEVREGDENPTRRVEIIHESLLANWPRLVRWQTQDADAAQLRDELRQAARAWDEHGRHDDRLWTGTAFREFALWRERYPGGLTDMEEAFARAMVTLSKRRKRRRRLAVAGAFVVLLAVLAVVGSFWRRSVTEARRAEAANLFSLAQIELQRHPTAAIAYAIGSLELADNPEVRRLVLEALWAGPTYFRLDTSGPYFGSLDFSPDGRWLATAAPKGSVSLWPSDGGPSTKLEGDEFAGELRISQRGDLIAATIDRGRRTLGLWSFPEGRFLRSITPSAEGRTYVFQFVPDGERIVTSTSVPTEDGYELVLQSWPVGGGGPDVLARLEVPEESGVAWSILDPSWRRLAWADGRRAHIARIMEEDIDLTSTTSVEHDQSIVFSAFDGEGRQLATTDTTGTIKIWSLDGDAPELTRTLSTGYGGTGAINRFSPSGSMLAGVGGLVWDLTAPVEAEPLQLRHPSALVYGLAFAPNGKWLATSSWPTVSLWPLSRTYPRILRGHEDYVRSLEFTPDGEHLVSTSDDGTVRVWPLHGRPGETSRVLGHGEGAWITLSRIAIAPDSSFAAIGDHYGRIRVFALDGSWFRELTGLTDRITAVAVGPGGRLVAAGTFPGSLRIWDLETGKAHDLGLMAGQIGVLEFTGNGNLWVATPSTLQRLSLDHERPRVEEEIDLDDPRFVGSQNLQITSLDLIHRMALRREGDRLWIQDLDTTDTVELGSYGSDTGCGLGASGRIVWSNDGMGTIRVGLTTGGEPHLLLGPEQSSPVVSPDGRWIATHGDDFEIRLWPVPDLSKPPIHTLPRQELIARLKGLTNLRVVRDDDSPTGWKLTNDPFPGWETVPTW